MKKIVNNFLTFVAATMLSITCYAQMADNSALPIVSDQKIIKNRPIGLDERVLIATDQPVQWSKSPFGYTGSYRLGETDYMATYDNNSHYIETYMKMDWNNPKVSSVVKSSLFTSPNKDQEVVGYWESSDPDENGYYLELKDKYGKQSNVWVDNQGNFYDTIQMVITSRALATQE